MPLPVQSWHPFCRVAMTLALVFLGHPNFSGAGATLVRTRLLYPEEWKNASELGMGHS